MGQVLGGGTYLSQQLVPDVGEVEPSPQLHGDVSTHAMSTGRSKSLAHRLLGGQVQRVQGVMGEGGVGHVEGGGGSVGKQSQP